MQQLEESMLQVCNKQGLSRMTAVRHISNWRVLVQQHVQTAQGLP